MITDLDRPGVPTPGFDRSGVTFWGATPLQNICGLMDELTYTYSGNKLIDIADAIPPIANSNGYDFTDHNYNIGYTDDYTYDSNGNMIADRNKGLTSITYNHLNLPEVVSFYDPANAEITWTYDSEGTKLRKTTNDGQGNIIVTDYINGYVYNDQAPDYYNTEEGRCLYSGGVYNTLLVPKFQFGSLNCGRNSYVKSVYNLFILVFKTCI